MAPEGDIHITQYHYPYDMRENMEQYYIEPLPENLEWIDRMAELANKNGVDLIYDYVRCWTKFIKVSNTRSSVTWL